MIESYNEIYENKYSNYITKDVMCLPKKWFAEDIQIIKKKLSINLKQ